MIHIFHEDSPDKLSEVEKVKTEYGAKTMQIDPKTHTYSATKYIGSFVGFAPVTNPSVVIIVVIDEPQGAYHGGDVAAPVFRDFMIAALKDAPATAFRTPPGMRLYRVSAATGLPAGAGEPAIYEAYKPGTEPGRNRDLGLRVPDEDETPIASGGTVEGETALAPMRRAPASGTGGLY